MPETWRESGDIESLNLPVISVYCCREWLVIPVVGWGKCGDCGRRPERREQ